MSHDRDATLVALNGTSTLVALRFVRATKGIGRLSLTATMLALWHYYVPRGYLVLVPQGTTCFLIVESITLRRKSVGYNFLIFLIQFSTNLPTLQSG